MSNAAATLENSLAVSYETKPVTAIQLQQLHSGHFSQRNENLHPRKNPCVNVHGSFICNSPKLERAKMSFGR